MAFYAIGGAESKGSIERIDGGLYSWDVSGSIAVVSTPTLAGSYCYEVDPVNGGGLDRYGWHRPIPNRSLLSVMFMFRFAALFDESVSIAELGEGSPGGNIARRLALTTDGRIQMQDQDGDNIDQTAASYIAVNTNYDILWYVDMRDTSNTRDILWVWKAGAWDKALDVADHGDATPSYMDNLTFGTRVGKGLPTSGGPFYVDEAAVQALGESPNHGAIGSITTKVKFPSANGTDGDFDTGSGAGGHPDYQLVDDNPEDGDATYDEGDVDGDKQSYAIADADGGDVPLAVNLLGSVKEVTAGAQIVPYIYDGTARDTVPSHDLLTFYQQPIRDAFNWTYNRINGITLTEALFNTLEAGIEITGLVAGASVYLSMIALEYAIEGPRALPSDFPARSFVIPQIAMRPLLVR